MHSQTRDFDEIFMEHQELKLLTNVKCYLVGHMQYADGQDWRTYITGEFDKLGITSFNPYQKPFVENHEENPAIHQEMLEKMERRDFASVAGHMKNIRNQDLNLCDRSDFIVAHIIPHVASWGSAEELVTSALRKKPVFISVEGGIHKTPLWLMGMFPIECFFDSVEKIVERVTMIHRGAYPMDSKRWRLLRMPFR